MHSSDTLSRWIRKTLDEVAGEPGRYDLRIRVSGESFIFPPGELSTLISNGVEQVTGRKPELSTTGGTSDARFIKDYCPVVEFGLVNATIHQVDEHTSVKDLEDLTEIYGRFIENYFASA